MSAALAAEVQAMTARILARLDAVEAEFAALRAAFADNRRWAARRVSDMADAGDVQRQRTADFFEQQKPTAHTP